MDRPPILIYAKRFVRVPTRAAPLQYAIPAPVTQRFSFLPIFWALLIAGTVLFICLGSCFCFSDGGRSGQAKRARLAATQSDLSSLSIALSQFATDTGRLPTTAEGLQALLTPPDDLANWHGPYIQHPPKDPWGNAYVYRVLTPATFDLRSAGSDGVRNTPDDIVAPAAPASP